MKIEELKTFFADTLKIDIDGEFTSFDQMLQSSAAYKGNVAYRKRIREKLFKPILQTLDSALITLQMLEDKQKIASEAPKPKPKPRRTRKSAAKKVES